MDSSKFTPATLVDTPISSIFRYSPPMSFEPVLQLAEAESRLQAAKETAQATVQAGPRTMLQSRRNSRLNRISIFLPNFMSNRDSKGEQDKLQKKPLPILPITPQASEHQSPQRSAPEPPTRLPPVVPAAARPQTPPPSSKKLHKAESPSRKLLINPSSPVASPPHIEGKKLRAASTLGPTAHNTDVGRRSVSSPIHTRTGSSDSEVGKLSKRKSWMPGLGKRSRNASSEDLNGHRADAWVNAGSHKIDYNLGFLISGEKVDHLDNITCLS
jgi:hypothetical protein